MTIDEYIIKLDGRFRELRWHGSAKEYHVRFSVPHSKGLGLKQSSAYAYGKTPEIAFEKALAKIEKYENDFNNL